MNTEQISVLSDDELYTKLQELGCVVGPIVASTRSLYERRLYKQLHGISACESSHESGGEEERDVHSDDDDVTSTVTIPSQSIYGSKVEFRHRPMKSFAEVHDGIYFDRSSLARGSYRSDLQNAPAVTKFQGANKGKYPTSSLQQPKKMPVALLAVVAFIVILAVLVYFNMESSSKSPIPNLPP